MKNDKSPNKDCNFIKAFLIKFLQKRNGLFDRVAVVEMIESRTSLRYFAQRYYRNYLKLFRKKTEIILPKKSLHALERMAQAFEPINFWSKLKSKFKK